jgi:aldehyde dehydrogenase (NAD+)
MWEYVKAAGGGSGAAAAGGPPPADAPAAFERAEANDAPGALPAIDRTPKLYVGGRQARPDSGYTRRVVGAGGRALGEVGEGNRKDLRNAVEAGAQGRRVGAADGARARAGPLLRGREPRGARRRSSRRGSTR